MARLFIRLKFAVTSNTIRWGDTWSFVGVIGVWLLAVAAGVGGGGLLAVAIAVVPGAEVAPVTAAVVLNAAWVLVPILASAIDVTLDPRSFETLPLTATQLGRGLLLASTVGPGGLATVLFVTIGLGSSLWPGPIGVFTVPVLTALLVLISVVSGRLATTVVSEVLSRNRIGEIASVAAGLVSVLAVLAVAGAAPESAGSSLQFSLPSWLAWLAVVPSGAVGAAFTSFEQGAVGIGVGYTAWAAVGAVALTWAYGTALERMQTRAVVHQRSRVRAGITVLGSWLTRIVPAPELRGVTAKELRYLRRDPRLRAQLAGGFATVVIFGFFGASLFDRAWFPFLAVMAVWAVTASVVPNQFGVDGGTVWGYVASSGSLSTVLAGKNVAWALVAAPVAAVTGVAGAIVAGSIEYLAASLLLAAVVFAVWTAVGNFTSIYGAFPFPEQQLFGSNTGGSGRAVIASLLGLVVSSALTGPPVVAVGVAAYLGGPAWAVLASAIALVYAVVVFTATARLAARIVVERRFQLVELLDED